MSSPPRQLVMLAGPNGGGKSTFFRSHLAGSPLPFLNADVLATELGIDALEAARLLDTVRAEFVDRGKSFITETVFSDPVGAKLELLGRAIANGYEVVVVFIGSEPDLLGLRVEQRVAAGGHDVPRERILPRFDRSLTNLRSALQLALTVKVYDNSSVTEPHRLLAVYERGRRTFLAASPLPKWSQPILGRGRRSRSGAKRRRR